MLRRHLLRLIRSAFVLPFVLKIIWIWDLDFTSIKLSLNWEIEITFDIKSFEYKIGPYGSVTKLMHLAMHSSPPSWYFLLWSSTVGLRIVSSIIKLFLQKCLKIDFGKIKTSKIPWNSATGFFWQRAKVWNKNGSSSQSIEFQID